MADRPKKKVQSGVVNPDRKNGKAPKKHPKIPKVLTPEERAARDLINQQKRDAARERKLAEEMQRQAEAAEVARKKAEADARKKRQRDAELRRAAARQGVDKIMHRA